MQTYLETVFFPLPAESGAWKDAAAKVSQAGVTYAYTREPTRPEDAPCVAIACRVDSPENAIYEVTRSSRISWHPDKGVPVRISQAGFSAVESSTSKPRP